MTIGLASLMWLLPFLLLAVAAALAVSWGVDVRLRRSRRLLDAGRRGAALRVYAALQRDVGAARRRARPWRSER